MLCSQWLVTGVTGNDVRGAAGRHALNGSQIKRRVNELSMMLKLGRITWFDNRLLHSLGNWTVASHITACISEPLFLLPTSQSCILHNALSVSRGQSLHLVHLYEC